MSLFQRFVESSERAGRARVLQVLRGFSEQQLKDSGISQVLLAQGLSAWPWRIEDEKSLNKTSNPVSSLALEKLAKQQPATRTAVTEADYDTAA